MINVLALKQSYAKCVSNQFAWHPSTNHIGTSQSFMAINLVMLCNVHSVYIPQTYAGSFFPQDIECDHMHYTQKMEIMLGAKFQLHHMAVDVQDWDDGDLVINRKHFQLCRTSDCHASV